MIIDFICAFIGTVAFSHLYNVPKKHYMYCGLVGALGYLCYCLADIRTSVTFATFLATMLVVLASRVLTIIRKCPITIFLISGIFPLVPGASVYNTAYYFVINDLEQATVWGINSLKVAFAIVLGIVFIVSIPRQMFTREYWKIWKVQRKKKKVVS
ncbi:MAG: threonine/serine exporter family protein [Tyzzerella sp.]|nr:threonine/serine exporter family protein [Tyzzerella sp.]